VVALLISFHQGHDDRFRLPVALLPDTKQSRCATLGEERDLDAEGSAFDGHVARFPHLLFLFRINKLHPNDAFARCSSTRPFTMTTSTEHRAYEKVPEKSRQMDKVPASALTAP